MHCRLRVEQDFRSLQSHFSLVPTSRWGVADFERLPLLLRAGHAAKCASEVLHFASHHPHPRFNLLRTFGGRWSVEPQPAERCEHLQPSSGGGSDGSAGCSLLTLTQVRRGEGRGKEQLMDGEKGSLHDKSSLASSMHAPPAFAAAGAAARCAAPAAAGRRPAAHCLPPAPRHFCRPAKRGCAHQQRAAHFDDRQGAGGRAVMAAAPRPRSDDVVMMLSKNIDVTLCPTSANACIPVSCYISR